MKIDDEQQDLQSLLMTKKEIKALRKYEKKDRENKKLSEREINDHDKIKTKLDNITELKSNMIKVDNKIEERNDKNDYMITEDEVLEEDNIEEDDTENDVNDNSSSMINELKQQVHIANQQISKQNQIIQQVQQSQQLQTTQQNSIQTFGNIPDLVKPKQSQDAGRVIQNQVATPPMDESGDIDLNKLFSSEMGNESEVVKELFSSENIKVKTDLTKDEVSIISRLELQASMTQNFFLAKIIKELETLRVSKDRKSRQEFVQSFSGIRQDQSGASAFGKLGNIFKNDKV